MKPTLFARIKARLAKLPDTYLYRGQFYTPADLIAKLEREGRLAFFWRFETVEAALDDLAERERVDRVDLASFTSNQFPKVSTLSRQLWH